MARSRPGSRPEQSPIFVKPTDALVWLVGTAVLCGGVIVLSVGLRWSQSAALATGVVLSAAGIVLHQIGLAGSWKNRRSGRRLVRAVQFVVKHLENKVVSHGGAPLEYDVQAMNVLDLTSRRWRLALVAVTFAPVAAFLWFLFAVNRAFAGILLGAIVIAFGVQVAPLVRRNPH